MVDLEDAQSDGGGRRRRFRWIAGILCGLLVLCAGGVVVGNRIVAARGERERGAAIAEVGRDASVGSWTEAKQALDRHAAALVAGDETGWLAAVDPRQPGLVDRYRQLYTRLRALDVSAWSYHVRVQPPTRYGHSDLSPIATVAWCLRAFTCPGDDPLQAGPKVSTLEQNLTMRRTGDRTGTYVITKVEERRLLPWQEDLRIAQGRRVTVAAPPRLAAELPAMVTAADQAATVSDRYATMIGNPQRRYRVYVAGDREWSSWFGRKPAGKQVVAYAIAIGSASTDVVLHHEAVRRADRVEVLRHEFGHVVTLAGTDRSSDAFYDLDDWLKEGIAEYIAFAPRPARSSPRLASVRAGAPPTTVVQPPLTDRTFDRDGDRFYGLGHLSVDCFAQTYGEAKLFAFVKLALRDKVGYDVASQRVFGRPFREVDRQCVAGIRRLTG